MKEQFKSSVKIISDDTDVFVLLLSHTFKEKLKFDIYMESPIKERKIIDMGKTIEKHKTLHPHLLEAHALSGHDTVSCYFGIGK